MIQRLFITLVLGVSLGSASRSPSITRVSLIACRRSLSERPSEIGVRLGYHRKDARNAISVAIGNSVTSIRSSPFRNTQLTEITFLGDRRVLVRDSFQSNSVLTIITYFECQAACTEDSIGNIRAYIIPVSVICITGTSKDPNINNT